MQPGPPPRRRSFALDAGLAVVVVVACGFFHNGGWHNQNSRFDAIVAFVEPGTPDSGSFRIDRFMVDGDGGLTDPPPAGGNTMDWAWFPPRGRAEPRPERGEVQGHYYSNKAPGPMLLGVPVYALLFLAERALALDPGSATLVELNLYLVNLWVSVLPLAVAAPLFRRLLLRLGVGQRRALALALLLPFGTLLFPYSTQLWGHTTAAAFAVVGLYGLLRDDRVGFALAGLGSGMAVLNDYLGIVVAVPLAIAAVARRPRGALPFAAGAGAPLLAFLAYHAACFGSPLSLPPAFFNPELRQEGELLGVLSWVSPDHLAAVTVSRYRGILVHMPVLLASLVGLCLWLRRAPRDGLAWLSLTVMGALLLVNAAFNGWHGGCTVAARYQIVALPFWVLCLKEVPWRRPWSLLLALTAALSAFNMLAIAAVSPTSLVWVPDQSNPATRPQYYNPFWVPPDQGGAEPAASPDGAHPAVFYDTVYGWSYRQLMGGHLAAEALRPLLFLRIHACRDWTPTNLGLLLGLPGLASLLPWLLVTGAGVAWLLWLDRRPDGPPPPVELGSPLPRP